MAVGEDEAEREATGRITEAGPLDVFELRAGDCLAELRRGESISLPAVPCSDPHRGEVVSTVQLPGGRWPGERAVSAAATRRCAAALRARPEGRGAKSGLETSKSDVEAFFYAPSESSWRQDDRAMTCVAEFAHPRSGPLGG